MSDFKRVTGKGVGEYLRAIALLAFILPASFFLSGCGGGGGGEPSPMPPDVTVMFGAAAYSVTEGASVTVTVTLSEDPEREVVIPVMADSTSTAATDDYSGLPESVTFASGETTKDIMIAATDDTAEEPAETVVLGFGTLPEGVTEGTTSSTTVNIADNDAPVPDVTVMFGEVAYSVTEGGSVTVEVTLSADPEREVVIPVMADMATSTAATDDYTLQSASVTFASGDTGDMLTKSITLDATDDDTEELAETVVLGFGTLPDGVSSIVPSMTTVTIADNDAPVGPVPDVTVSFGSLSYSAGEGGAAVSVEVTLSAAPMRIVMIPIEVATATTAGPGDYSGLPASVTFMSGDTSKNITLTITDDDVNEGSERLVLDFGMLPDGVTKGTHPTTNVIIADNDEPPAQTPDITVSFGAAQNVTEGASATVTVTLSADPLRDILIPITVGGTAQAGDYSGVPASVMFAGGDTGTSLTKSITLVATDDSDYEPTAETVILGFGTSLPTGVTTTTPSTTTVTIADNDPPPVVDVSFGLSAYSVTEGASATVTVTLSDDPMRDLEIDLVFGGMAIRDTDYMAPASVTFTSGQVSQSITLTTLDDSTYEGSETVIIGFAGTLPPGVNPGTTNATTTVTINDDDPPSAVNVSFGQAAYSVTEGVGMSVSTVDVTVTLSADPLRDVVIPLTIGGTATQTTDYTLSASSVTFGRGNTSDTITLTTVQNDTYEGDKTVVLDFPTQLPTGVTATTPDSTTVTITDDDPPPDVTVTFGSDTYGVAEGSSVSVTVTLDVNPLRDVMIPFTIGGTAAQPTDYTGVPANVMFTAGNTSQTITLVAEDDSAYEGNETVILDFATSQFPSGVTAGTPSMTTVTIADTDTPPDVVVSFGQTTYNTAEGGTAASVMVTLDADPQRDVMIPLTFGGTATRPGDYTGVPDNVTFTSGNTSQTITLTPVDDGLTEGSETAILGFGTQLPPGVTTGTTDSTIVTIADNEPVPAVKVSFGEATYSASEAGTVATVAVSLDTNPLRDLAIPLTIGGTATRDTDYTLSASSVMFTSGTGNALTQTITLTPMDDSIAYEGNEDVVLGFVMPLPQGVTTGTHSSTMVTITDNDTLPPAVEVSFDAAAYTASEDGTAATIMVTLSANPEREVVIPLTIGGTATRDTDYTGVPASLTFASGTGAALTKTITVTPMDDTENESDETVTLGFGTPLPPGISEGTTASTMVTITDNDAPPPAVTVMFGANTYDTAEGGAAATVAVTLSANPERTVVIPLAVDTTMSTADAAEYMLSTESVTFMSGQISKNITLTAMDDSEDEATETVVIGFGTSLPTGVTKGTPGSTTVRIADNDVNVSFDLPAYSVTEGGMQEVGITLTTAPPAGSSITIPLAVDTMSTATPTTDYSGVPASVTFGANELRKSFTVTTQNNTSDEPDKTVIIGFGDLPTGISEGSTPETIVTIEDNDVEVSFARTAYSVAEDGTSVTVTVTLSSEPETASDVVIPLVVDTTMSTATRDTDYTLPANVTFPDGDTSEDITITIVDDAVDEDENETVIIGFGMSLPAEITPGTNPSTTVTIEDNDDPDVTVSFEMATYSVTEGASQIVRVMLNADPEREVVIPFTVTGSATRDTDYTLPANVTFGSGQTSRSISLTTTNDSLDEPNEMVTIGFGTPLPDRVTAGTTNPSTTVTIEDNDVFVSFGEADYSVREGGTVDVTVTLSAALNRSVTIGFAVDDDSTADLNTDYSYAPAGLMFAVGETEKILRVSAMDDSVDDDGETVILGFGTVTPIATGIQEGVDTSMPPTTVTITDAPLVASCDNTEAIPVPPGTDVYDLSTSTVTDPDAGHIICGNTEDNFIKGAAGDDAILSNEGDDMLQGRAGDDTLDGGDDEDTAIYWIVDETAGTLLDEALDVNLETGVATDGHGDTDALANIENVKCDGSITTDNNQTFSKIVGDGENNKLWSCNNSSADDLLIGNAGDDTFVPSSGDNYYDGGEGADTFDCSACLPEAGAVINLGNFTATSSMGPDSRNYAHIGPNNYAIPENGDFTAGGGDSTIENVIGSSGSDSIIGDSDHNRLEGGEGVDTLTGNAGDDTLDGGAGDDTLMGNAGDDTYYAEDSDTVTELANEGDDVLYYYTDTAVTHSLTYTDIVTNSATAKFAPANIETVYGTSGADILRAAAGNVTVIGGDGNDTLIGGDGDNTLIGCAGQNNFYSNTGFGGDDPYTLPEGVNCVVDNEAPEFSCADGVNTFVLVYDSTVDSAANPSRIQSFRDGDKIVLAGFPDQSGGNSPSFAASVAMVSEIPRGWTSEPTTVPGGLSSEWIKFSVNDTVVAWIQQLGFTQTPGPSDTIPRSSNTLANIITANEEGAVVTIETSEDRCD